MENSLLNVQSDNVQCTNSIVTGPFNVNPDGEPTKSC